MVPVYITTIKNTVMKSLFVEESTQNIFIAFLKFLNVKHTKIVSGKYYQERLYKYSLYGIFKMFIDYKIENIAIKIKKKLISI